MPRDKDNDDASQRGRRHKQSRGKGGAPGMRGRDEQFRKPRWDKGGKRDEPGRTRQRDDRFHRARDDVDRPRGHGFHQSDEHRRERDRDTQRSWGKRTDQPRQRRDRDGRERRWDAPAERANNDRPKFGRPRFERPRSDEIKEERVPAKRPAFGGRGPYRERKEKFERHGTATVAGVKKPGERVAKVIARAGVASRRDAEQLILQGRVTVNGRVINSPALDVTSNDGIAVDGKPLPARQRTRLFLYHKPRGLMTTHSDPEGRPTVFDSLPEGLPRLISVGRLDFNTEGLLLLTNDGGLARVLELPETGWLRRYRVRAHGEVRQAQLDQLKQGIEIDGVKYGPVEAVLEREQGTNVWLVVAIREGKNREVRNVLAQLGLEVNRLIRISYGPFQLSELAGGAVEEVKTRVLREQLGEKVIRQAGADFTSPVAEEKHGAGDTQRGNSSFKPSGKSALIADRKGRRVLVQRTGSEEARVRNEAESGTFGRPRRPRRGYHGKRDLKPRGE